MKGSHYLRTIAAALCLLISLAFTPQQEEVISLTLEARYPSIQTPGEYLPARHIRYGLMDEKDQWIELGYLDEKGQKTIQLPKEQKAKAVFYTDICIHHKDKLFFHGNVINTPPLPHYTPQAYETTCQQNLWGFVSPLLTAQCSWQIKIDQPESGRVFAITDCMVDFAKGMIALDDKDPLPNLSVFAFPGASIIPPLSLCSEAQEAIWHEQDQRPAVGLSYPLPPEQDADGTYRHHLMKQLFISHFAQGSFWKIDNGQRQVGHRIRAGNTNLPMDENQAIDPSLAFAHGFSDFFAEVFNHKAWQPTTTDIKRSLQPHDREAYGGEYYAKAIGDNLWSIWYDICQHTPQNLFSLWNLAQYGLNPDYFSYFYQPLPCYSTYLAGMVSSIKDAEMKEQIKALILKDKIGVYGDKHYDVTNLKNDYYTYVIWERLQEGNATLAHTFQGHKANQPFAIQNTKTYAIPFNGAPYRFHAKKCDSPILIQIIRKTDFFTYSLSQGESFDYNFTPADTYGIRLSLSSTSENPDPSVIVEIKEIK